MARSRTNYTALGSNPWIGLAAILCALSSSVTASAQIAERDPRILRRLPPVEHSSRSARIQGSTGRASATQGTAHFNTGTASGTQVGNASASSSDVAFRLAAVTEARRDPSPLGPLPLPQITPEGVFLDQYASDDGAARESLVDAWQIALSVDQQRLAASARICAAVSARDAAAAGASPTATASGQYTLRDNEPAYLITTPLLATPLNAPYMQAEDFAFDGRIDMPLYQGGRVTNDVAAADSRVQATQFQRARYELDLKMSVAHEYVGVLRAEQTLLLAQSHELSLAAHARDTEMFHKLERVPLNDLLAAQVALSDAQHRVIRARSELEAARAAYNRLLGRPFTSDVRLEPLKTTEEPLVIETLMADAVARRPELCELGAQIAAHRHRAESLLANNRAQVHLQGAYTFRENRYQEPEGITSAGVGVWWNLYDGGRTENLAQEELRQAQALAHHRADLQSRIQLEVRRAWLDVQESRQRLVVTRQAIDRAEENLRVTRQRYASGMATNTDVLTAETLRVQTYHNHNNSVYDAVLAELRLLRATAEI